MKTKDKIYSKLRSLILFLDAHPENEDNSEMRDRLDDAKEMALLIHEYATEAVKADRERILKDHDVSEFLRLKLTSKIIELP